MIPQIVFPSNEAETITIYKLAQDKLSWRISHLQTAFPDAIIENSRGQRLVIEFEYLAKNFKAHKHDKDGCDLIVCWHNDWGDAPLPVWELRTIGFCTEQARVIGKGLTLRLNALKRQVAQTKREKDRTLRALKNEVTQVKKERDQIRKVLEAQWRDDSIGADNYIELFEKYHERRWEQILKRRARLDDKAQVVLLQQPDIGPRPLARELGCSPSAAAGVLNRIKSNNAS